MVEAAKSTETDKQELFKALAQFHQNLKQPSKDAKNPYFNNDYVSLEGVQKAVDEACKGTGLTYTQLVFDDPKGTGKSVMTVVLHSSGQSLKSGALTLVPQKKDPQGYGSAITYAKRYQLAAIFGISSELDDDGNKSSQTAQKVMQQRNYQQRGYQQNRYNNGGNNR